jgi:long-subunit fatty acid transport protein
MKYIALLVVVCLMPLHADFAKLGTSGAQFLKIGVGRGAAMGEAFVAVADDASATFWNPSGLATVTAREVSFYHNEWIADVRHEYLSAAFPLGGFGTMGVSITALTMGEMEILTVDDPNTTIR